MTMSSLWWQSAKCSEAAQEQRVQREGISRLRGAIAGGRRNLLGCLETTA